MRFPLTDAMCNSIIEAIMTARSNTAILDVYAAAERIRLHHIEDNVALEDIVNALVLQAGTHTAISFDNPPGPVLEMEPGEQPPMANGHDQRLSN